MNISKLIDYIAKIPNCRVRPSQSMPRIDAKHALPSDVLEFYALCGGTSLFVDQEYPYSIASPSEFARANPVIIRDFWQEWEGDISSDWYIIAFDAENQYLTIDLNLQRLGRCYDSFIGRHAVRGDCPIIATSFTKLLNRLVENQGQYPYWLAPGFESLGDAYDAV